MATKTVAYHETRIDALYTELEALEESPVSEYTVDNAGQRMGVKYRTREQIQKAINFHQRQINKINGTNRALAVFRGAR